jgi:ketosteroid isomerase-like protein
VSYPETPRPGIDPDAFASLTEAGFESYERNADHIARLLRDEARPSRRRQVIDNLQRLRRDGVLGDADWQALVRGCPELALHVAFAALNEGDLDGYLALIDEDVEFTSMVAEAEGTTFRGHEGVREWWRTVRGAFEEVGWELLEVRDYGDRAVVKLCMAGTIGGVRVEQTMWQLVTQRDGMARSWHFFRTEREAEEAAEKGR